jgi:MFS family permease
MLGKGTSATRTSIIPSFKYGALSNDSIPKTVDEAIESVGFGAYQTRMLAIVGIVSASEPICATFASISQSCLQVEWGLSDYQETILASSSFAGQIVGFIFGGSMANVFGKRYALLVGMLMLAVFSTLTAFIDTYMIFIATRIMAGVGIGFTKTIANDLVIEMLPVRQRSYATYLQLISGLGMLYVIALSWMLLADYGWRAVAVGAAVPSIVSLVLTYAFIYESPRWLCYKNRYDEATDIILKIQGKRFMESK